MDDASSGSGGCVSEELLRTISAFDRAISLLSMWTYVPKIATHAFVCCTVSSGDRYHD